MTMALLKEPITTMAAALPEDATTKVYITLRHAVSTGDRLTSAPSTTPEVDRIYAQEAWLSARPYRVAAHPRCRVLPRRASPVSEPLNLSSADELTDGIEYIFNT